ncbi:MAG: hypothetical protein HQK52_18425 [Oligoflexia bacterium]|nr:hypothetical protein [Oligoflexia bacterium]
MENCSCELRLKRIGSGKGKRLILGTCKSGGFFGVWSYHINIGKRVFESTI